MKNLIVLIAALMSFSAFSQTFHDTQYAQNLQPGHIYGRDYKAGPKCYLGGRYSLQTLANEIGKEVEFYVDEEQEDIEYVKTTAWNPVKTMKSYNPSQWIVNSSVYFRLITLDVTIINADGDREVVKLKDCDARYTTEDHVFTIEECLIKGKKSSGYHKDPEMVFYVDLSHAKRC